MTVGRLKAMLNEYDDDTRIVFQPSNSMYGEHIDDVEENKGIASLRGNDYKALILTSSGRCGAVCNEGDLDLDSEE